jgi:hypothetical protein
MDQSLEQWRPVVGYEGRYEVSDHGRVRSLDRTVPHPRLGTQFVKGRLLRHWVLRNGYAQVSLHVNGTEKKETIHRMVLAAFTEVCPDRLVAAHNDGNPLNNHVSNLRWSTQKENINDKRLHGTMERSGNRKVTEDMVREVRLNYKKGDAKRIARNLGISVDAVYHIVRGKTWKHVIP